MTQTQALTREQLAKVGDYFAIDRVNQSTLKKILKSPKHYRHGADYASVPTALMSQGTANHIAVLEPARFMTHFAMWNRRSESGNLCPRKGQFWDAFQADNDGREIVTEPEYLKALAVQSAVRSDVVASPYLRHGTPEVTLLWTDERTGVECKCRLDWLNTDGGYIVDLKGVSQIAREPFFTHVDRMGYDFQAAFYGMGYKTIFGKWPAYKIVTVEMSEPHDVAVYNVPDGFMEEDYESQIYPALQDLKQCRASNNWPGIANNCEMTLARPRWRRDDMELELGD